MNEKIINFFKSNTKYFLLFLFIVAISITTNVIMAPPPPPPFPTPEPTTPAPLPTQDPAIANLYTYSNSVRYPKEVFSGLTLCGIDGTGFTQPTDGSYLIGKKAITGQNMLYKAVLEPNSTDVYKFYPVKIKKGGVTSLISITGTLGKETSSYTTGSTWMFFLGANGGYNKLTAGWNSALYFPANDTVSRTFYYPLENINLEPGDTLSIKGVQLTGIINNITIGFVFKEYQPPSIWI